VVVGALPQPPHVWISSPGKGLFHHPASAPFRKFDEEVLRTLRGFRPHPVRAGSPGPPGRDGPLPLALDPERTLRAAARGSGVGVEDDHGRSACSRGAAVKLHVEITSRSQSTNLRCATLVLRRPTTLNERRAFCALWIRPCAMGPARVEACSGLRSSLGPGRNRGTSYRQCPRRDTSAPGASA